MPAADDAVAQSEPVAEEAEPQAAEEAAESVLDDVTNAIADQQEGAGGGS